MHSSFLPWQGKLWVLTEGGGSTVDCRKFLQIFPPWCSYLNPHPGVQPCQNREGVSITESSPLPTPGIGEALTEVMFWLGLKVSLHLPLKCLILSV